MPGAPGFTNLFYRATTGDATEALAAATKSRLLIVGFGGRMNSSHHIDLVTDVRLLDEASGDLVDIFTVSGITGVTGANGGTFVAPAGACIDWLTTTVHGSRRIQGRTFVVPVSTSVFDNDGSIEGSNITALATAAENMRTASGPAFGIWGRPRLASAGPPPVTARAGLWAPATASRVPDKSVVLRSRRD